MARHKPRAAVVALLSFFSLLSVLLLCFGKVVSPFPEVGEPSPPYFLSVSVFALQLQGLQSLAQGFIRGNSHQRGAS
jgi:hypothetical protein